MAVVSLFREPNRFNVAGEGMTIEEMNIHEQRAVYNDLRSQMRRGELTPEQAQDKLDNMARFELDATSYGDAVKINLAGEHDFLVTKEGLDGVAVPRADSPYPYNIQISGAERLVLSPEVIAELDPNVFNPSEDLNAGNSWMQTGELFSFGDENNTRFILNNEYLNKPGVETIVIGDQEINFGDRMREINELASSESVADMAQRDELMNGLYGDIKNAVIEAQSAPSVEMENRVAPSSAPNIQTPGL